jgi:hypothetical protein
MPGSLTLIVLVAAGGSPSGTEALLQAAHQSLGSETEIEVRETPREPTDVDVLSTERREHADAVAELVYKDRKRRQVTLRVHVAKPRRWLERTLVFDAADVEVERARTLGYAMAAILPEPFPHHLEDPKPPPAPEPPPPPPPPPAPRPNPSPPPPKPDKPPPPAESPVRPHRFEIELLGIGGSGVGQSAGEGGGELAAQIRVVTPVSLRIAGGVESGSIGLVNVKTWTIFGSLGVAFRVLRPTVEQPFGVTVRADLTHAHVEGSHPGDPTLTQDLNGFDSFGQVGWQFVQHLEAVLGVGVAMFPPFDVQIHHPQASDTRTPLFRIVGEAGLLVAF